MELNEQRLREAVEFIKMQGGTLTPAWKEIFECAELVLSVQAVLPDKKATGCKSPEHINNHCYGDSDCPECTQNVGYNEAIDAYILAISKKLLGLEEIINENIVYDCNLESKLPISHVADTGFLAEAIRSELLGREEK